MSQNPDGLPLLEISSPTANKFSKAVSCLNALFFSLDCLRLLIDKFEALSKIEKKSLFHSALVSYFKAYQHGGSLGFNSDIYRTLPGDAVSLHSYLKDLRDKHISHLTSVFEDVKVGVLVEEDKVIGRGSFTVSFEGYDIETLKMIYNLIVVAKDFMKKKVSELEADFNKEIDTLDLGKMKLRVARFTAR